MENILLTSNCVLILSFACYAAISTKRYRRLHGKIENMSLEQSKINFRIFVAEKKLMKMNEK